MKRFCIPPEHSGAFVQAMEDVLDVYHLPYDAQLPVVCFDETSKQLVQHVREPIASRRGTPARVDDEYKRCGTANVFLAIEPLAGVVLIEATRKLAQHCRVPTLGARAPVPRSTYRDDRRVEAKGVAFGREQHRAASAAS